MTSPSLGSSLPRKEDYRLLTGRGRYVSDLVVPGMLHAAFVRSPFAHAMVNGVDASAALAVPGVVTVLTADDPKVLGVRITARSELASYVETSQPVLAWPKARFAGEAVAVVVATDRTVAADASELVDVTYEPLPVVVDPRAATEAGEAGAVVHKAAPDNVYVRRRFEGGDPDAALAASHLVLERSYRINRQAAAPIEGRAAVASWDPGDRSLTLWSSTQIPHVTRHALAVLLGLAEHHIRVVAPDVGGGFGVKASVYPEEVALCLLAIRLGRPVKWVESRSEHMVAAHHARDHAYQVTAGFEADGRLTALVGDVVCNAGAYSPYPFTAALEPLMAGGLLPGPYRLEHYRCDVAGVATNTVPAGPYRGVARPATVFVMERLLDTAAAQLGLDPVEIRRVNLITPEEIPYRAATRLVHDSRSYGATLDAVLKRLDYQRFRAEQATARDEGRLLGVGFAVYNELTGMGGKSSPGPGVTFRPGHEVVTVRLDALGGVTVLTGASAQGQGIETTFAQIAADTLGVRYDDVEVRLGDTASGGFGFGAFASRQAVIGGGAVLRATEAVREKVLRIAAHILEAAPDRPHDRRRPGAAHRRTVGPIGVGGHHRPGRLPRHPAPPRGRGTGPGGDPQLRPGAGHVRRRRSGGRGRGRSRNRRGVAPALRVRGGRRRASTTPPSWKGRWPAPSPRASPAPCSSTTSTTTMGSSARPRWPTTSCRRRRSSAVSSSTTSRTRPTTPPAPGGSVRAARWAPRPLWPTRCPTPSASPSTTSR